jgi:hypothetical protein
VYGALVVAKKFLHEVTIVSVAGGVWRARATASGRRVDTGRLGGRDGVAKGDLSAWAGSVAQLDTTGGPENFVGCEKVGGVGDVLVSCKMLGGKAEVQGASSRVVVALWPARNSPAKGIDANILCTTKTWHL